MDTATATSQLQLSDPLPRRAETSDSPSVCSFCQRRFTRRDALKRHWGICKVRLENGSDIPLLPARRPRLKKPRACNRCVRLKRACDRSFPCSTCSIRNYECSYERAASSKTSAVSEDSSQAEINGVYQQEISDGVVKADDAMPVVLAEFIDYSLEWLRSQRRQLNNTLNDSSFQDLTAKTGEILGMIKRTLTRTRSCSHASIEWSPIVEKACLDFFSPSNLHRFILLFWSGWYPNSPIIHKPTFNSEAEPPGLIASMAVLGACLSPDSNDFVRAMAWLTPVEEVVFADNILYDDSIIASSDLVGDEAVVWDKLKALHAAYFICIAQNWEGSKEGRQRVRKDRYSRIVSIARSFGLYNLSLAKLDTTFSTQQKWARFILLESMIRTATYIYLLDSAFVLYYRLPPRVISLELNTGLVCPEVCFQAESAAECFLQLHMATMGKQNQSRLTVSSAVRLLCSPHSLDLSIFHNLSSFNMFTIISGRFNVLPPFMSDDSVALCCLVFQYQTTLVDVSQVTPAATGLSRWIWLWQRDGHIVVDSDGYSVENMWKRAGFMQHANEYYHLACAMLERWKLSERQIGNTLTAWAAPLGSVQGNPKYDDGEMVQVKALIHDMENMTY
ncbi:hypothetical protein FOXG_18347 [Fusarium oxysporum f. sp. lycopersici 4287]|uniref:Zn(2)-C6 fungal-type domain-containing protein n=1 Tax=Fusarium oxysporum f. sp. lycopersici (strain 4287 / CBS 123668 / FGSC 9935 / NRRL 34936) TaxID=426428 RepID=A0A0J9UH21_FUSO4|nr:hypothetical protein FOXG_18347 [Fusarium oxysporum f. sp. lycopersici 4287]KNA98142.1 hypothetical protein FOXG_18347 [Fusarium oxysporum f. sp. lycopersici 4287]